LTIVPEVAPSNKYGTVVGIFGSFEDAGTIVGPIVFGFIWSAFSPALIFAAASITQILGAFLIILIARQQHVSESSAPNLVFPR
jgi:MFS family permease